LKAGGAPKRILAIDVGGTHVKLLASHAEAALKFKSGPRLSPDAMVRQVKALARDWGFDAVSIGYPGLVVLGRIAVEPAHLGRGWVKFDFAKALGRPVRIINDAAMQALGNDTDGSLLFLGLGTALGMAMVVDGRPEAIELGHLPYQKGRTYDDYLGVGGLERLGRKKWERHVWKVVTGLQQALAPDRVVVGGGNAAKLSQPPAGVVLGGNAAAFGGGFRLWCPQWRGHVPGA
jgi:polyphosphate glucokinase